MEGIASVDDSITGVGDFSLSNASPTEERVHGFFEALKTRKKLEAQSRQPMTRDDPLVKIRLKEIDAYVDVFMKSEALRRPRFTLLKAQTDPNAVTLVSVEFRDAVQFYEGLALSLSTGGIFIKTKSLLPIDSILNMEVNVKQEEISFTVSGKVIWVNPRESQGRPTGLGSKFFKLSTIQRQIVTDFMSGELDVDSLGHLSE